MMPSKTMMTMMIIRKYCGKKQLKRGNLKFVTGKKYNVTSPNSMLLLNIFMFFPQKCVQLCYIKYISFEVFLPFYTYTMEMTSI